MNTAYEFSKLQAQSDYYELMYDAFITQLRKLRNEYTLKKCIFDNQTYYVRDIYTDNAKVIIVIGECTTTPKHELDIVNSFTVEINQVKFHE